MAIQIDDGKGRGFVASVSDDNRLNISAKTNPRIYYVSRDKGLAFMLTSVDADAVAGDYILYLKNTSATRQLFVKRIATGAANAALWKSWVVTGTAAGSSLLVPTNINLTSGKTADATCRGNGAVSGLTTGGLLDVHRTGAGEHDHSLWEDALILGTGDAIAVEYDTGTTGLAEVSIEFHFEEIGGN